MHKLALSNVEDINQYAKLVIDTICCGEMVAIANTDLSYVYMSKHLIPAFGFSPSNNSYNHTIYNVNAPITEIAGKLRELEQACISEKKTIELTTFLHLSNGWGFYLIRYTPLISCTDKILGLQMRLHKIPKPLLSSDLIFQNVGTNLEPNNIKNSYEKPAAPKLTNREQLILFLLTANYSTKHIAETISNIEHKDVSASLIRNNINQQLYVKFAVNSISSLIQKAIMLDFMQLMPNIMLRQYVLDTKYA